MTLSARQTSALKLGTSVAASVLACLLLQAAFSLFYWLPTRSLRVAARPSADALALIGIALLFAHLAGRSPTSARVVGVLRRSLLIIAPLLVLLCVLLGIAQGIALREFGYHFTLAYHTSKVQALFVMMYEAQSTPVFLGVMALLLAAIAILVLGSLWALRRVLDLALSSRRASLILAGSTVCYGLLVGALLDRNGSMIRELAGQLDEVAHREQRLASQAKKIEGKMKKVRTLKLGDDLRRPTVLVFVVESYGQVLMEAEKYAEFRVFLGGIEKDLQAAGYAMRSSVFRSPVFGGSSWLANATILCRLMVPTEKTYFSLMKTQTKCLPSQFNEAGYESVFVASNTTEFDGDYASRFPFESFIPRDDLGYEGPRMSWSYMPDQYVIDVIERRILATTSTRPRFIYYKLSSSHHPWDTIPPYIKNWSLLRNGKLYDKTKNSRYPDNAFLGGKHYNEGYDESIRYSLETIAGYLEAMPADRDVLALVLGDHQPRRPVAIMDKDPWTVPMHVLSRDHELVERFARQEYSPGLLVKPRPGLVPGLELVAENLFRALNDVTVIESEVRP